MEVVASLTMAGGEQEETQYHTSHAAVGVKDRAGVTPPVGDTRIYNPPPTNLNPDNTPLALRDLHRKGCSQLANWKCAKYK